MELRPGQILGPYRLVAPPGTNGLPGAWRATQRGDGRPVTLTVLSPPDRPADRERVLREVRALAHLHHPAILPILDLGEYEGHALLVTPLVDGLTLDWLLGERWPLAEALLVLEPLAAALDYAHARGVVHGRLRPTSVLIADGGRVYLTGPGLAANGSQAALKSEAGRRPYLAPECLAGQPPTPAADRYALGALAFELLAGRPPFAAEAWPGELGRQSSGPLDQPCTLSALLTPPMVEVLRRALAPQPEARYSTARDLVASLAQSGGLTANQAEESSTPATSPGVVSSEPTEPWAEPDSLLLNWRWRPAIVGLASLLFLAGLAGLVGRLVVGPIDALLAGRGKPAVVLLDNGNVLVAGGCRNQPSDGSSAAALEGLRTLGRKQSGSGLADALLFSPAANRWSAARSLQHPRCGVSGLRLGDGRVLVLGGRTDDGQPIMAAERYNPRQDSWNSAGRLILARTDFSLTLLPSGQVLVAGGRGVEDEPLASVERYDPSSNHWTLTAGLAQPRAGHTATLLPDGQVLVAGGIGALGSAERYDQRTNSWAPAGSLRQARAHHSATLLPDGQVLVVGGLSGRELLASVERYDPQKNIWARATLLDEPRRDHTATLLPDGEVLVVGGSGREGALATALRYNPRANAWSPAAALPQPRSQHTAIPLPGGQVLVLGGRASEDGPYLNTALIYDPVRDGWTPAPDLPP